MVDGLCGRDPPSRADYSSTWSLEEWLELLNSLTAFFRLAVGNNSSDEVVRQPAGQTDSWGVSLTLHWKQQWKESCLRLLNHVRLSRVIYRVILECVQSFTLLLNWGCRWYVVLHRSVFYVFIQPKPSEKGTGVFTVSSCGTAGWTGALVVRNDEWLLSGQILRSPHAGCVQVLAGLSDVESSHAEAMLSVLRARREEIRRALLDRTNSISTATLQDFDWQLKVTACFIL